MILLLSLGFGLGVLACVAADAIERRRRYPTSSASMSTNVVAYGNWTSGTGYLVSDNLARYGFQDSTLPAKDS